MKMLFVLISFLSMNAFADNRSHDTDLSIILNDSTIQQIFNKEQGNEIQDVVFVEGRSYNVVSAYCEALVEIKTECQSMVPRHPELDVCEDKVEVKSLACKN